MKYQMIWQREYRAKKHDGVIWPKGRPAKHKPWPPPPQLHCIYCSMLLHDPFHIKHPCWKSKLAELSTIFAEKKRDDA